MALGKNLKKKKLISNEPEKATREKTNKSPLSKKKPLIIEDKISTKKAPPVKKKPAAKKKPAVKKEPVPQKKQEKEQAENPLVKTHDSALSIYIANELRERKNSLRAKYSEQIESIKGQTIQFISCLIGGESYAFDIDQVKEIVQMPNISKTPNTPPHIKGIAFVRGINYVVFDLAERFQIANKLSYEFLLIINSNEIKASLALPALPSTFKVEGKFISSEMNMIEDASLDISYIKGIIQHNGSLIYYLDIIEVLKNDKAVVVPDSMITG